MISTALCISDSWFRLGFLSLVDLNVPTWVTPAELYQFADDALKRLARVTSIFVTYDTSVVVALGISFCQLPAGYVFADSAWIVGGTQLRITSTADLFALDQAWSLTPGAPRRISFDAAGANRAALYPVPIGSGTLGIVMGAVPATVTSAAPTIAVSPVMADYFTYAMIAGARGKESDSAMPEVAAHIQERMTMYESIFTQLWGKGR